MSRVDKIIPILNVGDVAASLDFYIEELGFERPWHWGDPPTFGGVRAGDQEIQFCQDGQGHPGTWLAVWVDDVDAWYDRLRTKAVDIRQPPTTFPWGVRELNVADPDGHRIRFSAEASTPPDDADFPQ